MRKEGLSCIQKHPRKRGWLRGIYFYERDGRQSTKYLSGQSKTEVRNLAESFSRWLAREREREAQPLHGISVEGYLRNFEKLAFPNLAPNTRIWYGSTFRTHIYGTTFAELRLADAKKQHVAEFLGTIPSTSVRHRVRMVLHSAFQRAVEMEQLPSNPAKLPRSHTPRRPKSDVVAFEPQHEVKLLALTLHDARWQPLLMLAFDSGIREGELLGLRWCDIDFDKRVVQVRQSLKTINGRCQIGPLKTKASRRDIEIAASTSLALKRLYAACGTPDKTALVFTSPRGKPWRSGDFWKAWSRLLARAELPHYHFHAVRHSCAVRLLRAGCYITAVAARLGHSRPSITLDRYSNAIPSDQGPLAAQFENFVRQLDAALDTAS